MKGVEPGTGVAFSRQTWISATFILVSTTLVSKALGFIRDVLVAGYFGAGAEVDAFMVAVAPATVAGGIGSAVAAAFIPAYRHRIGTGDGVGARRLAGDAIGLTLLCSAGVMVLLVAFPEFLVGLVAPALPEATAGLAVQLARMLAALVLGLNMIYVLSAVYNAVEHFKIPAVMDLMSNVFVLLALVLLAEWLGIQALALGLGIGTLAVVLAMVPPMWSRQVVSFAGGLQRAGLIELVLLGTPVFLFEVISQAAGIVENFFGSRLESGSIAALGYAKRLSVLVVSLVAVNTARAVFPVLSKLIAEQRIPDARDLFVKLIRQYAVAFVPLMLGLAYFSHEIVRLAFQRGAFDTTAAERTAVALIFYSVGTIPLAATPILIRACYAFSDTITPLVASVVGLVAMAACNMVLAPWLGVAGIALSTSLGLFPGAALMGWALARRFGGLEPRRLTGVALQAMVCATAALGPVVALQIAGPIMPGAWLPLGLGAALYALGYAILGWFVMHGEVRLLWALLRRGY